MDEMFAGYGDAMGEAYDEMFEGDDLRSSYTRLRGALQQMSATEIHGRVDALQNSYLDQGVTFDIGGEERGVPLDRLSRRNAMEQWARVEAGVQQRVRTLERFLDDVYDAGRVFDEG